MKTSLKLLLGIAVAVLLTMVGAGWSFRQQYDQLDHTDPFAQFSKQPLPAFRVLKLVGSPGKVFLVQPGPVPTLRTQSDYQPKVAYRMVGDTLLVRYTPSSSESADDRGIQAGAALSVLPIAVLSVPTVQTVLVENATCKLDNWKLASLMLTQTGPNGATALDNTTINDLQTTVSGGSLVQAEGKNTIGRATVTVRDKASFIVGNTKFTSLVLHADSTALITMPGALLAKVK